MIVFAVFVCTIGIASALVICPKYVGNTVVDLEWSKYGSEDFSCYKLYRNDSQIATIPDRNTTFYCDTGQGKGVMYYYKIEVYNRTTGVFELGVFSRSVTPGRVQTTARSRTTPHRITAVMASTWMIRATTRSQTTPYRTTAAMASI